MFRGIKADGSRWDVAIDVYDERIWRIGRHPTNDLVLNDARIPLLASRFHARVTRAPDEQTLWIETTSTTNGTYINNVPLRHMCILRHGDIVTFGGPCNVSRDGRVMRNPFRFAFVAPVPIIPPTPPVPVQNRGVKRRREEELPQTPTQPADDERAVQLTAIKNEVECPICQELFLNPQTLGACGHVFCAPCISIWIRQKGSRAKCPVCRTPVAGQPTPACVLQNLIVHTIEPLLNDTERLERAQRQQEWTSAQTRRSTFAWVFGSISIH